MIIMDRKVLVSVSILFCASFGVLSSGVCAQEKIAFEDARPVAQELMDRLFSGYRNYSRPEFEALVAEDFRPLRVRFLSDIESNVHGGRVLGLDYFIDKVLTAKNRLVVIFRWEKKTVPAGGEGPVLSRGKARAVFGMKKGVWKLLSMGGNNPF